MTFDILTAFQESVESLTEDSLAVATIIAAATDASTADDVKETETVTETTKSHVAKDHRTKAQKRRDLTIGEKCRGHNWVDLVSHLRKTGSSK